MYVPGNNEKMLGKCASYSASLLVPDIEDSVPLQEKPMARELLVNELPKIR